MAEKGHFAVELFVRGRDAHDEPRRLRCGSYSIGRGKTADIVLPSGQISRHHCTLVVTETTVSIEDAGSKNGFRLNGKVARNAIISPADRVVLPGFSLSFRWLSRAIDVANRPEPSIETQVVKRAGIKGEPPAASALSNDLSEASAIGGGWDDYLPAGLAPKAQRLGEETTVGPQLDQPPVSVVTRGEPEREFEDFVTAIRREGPALIHPDVGLEAVEVLRICGSQLHGFTHLAKGESLWWPRRKRFVTSPSRECFPLVQHLSDGRCQVMVPDSTHWECGHQDPKGRPFAQGDFRGIKLPQGARAQIKHGHAIYYLRWVSLPVPSGWGKLRDRLAWPRPITSLAVVASLLAHLVFFLLPRPPAPIPQFSFEAEPFAEVSFIVPPPAVEEVVVPPVPKPSPPVVKMKSRRPLKTRHKARPLAAARAAPSLPAQAPQPTPQSPKPSPEPAVVRKQLSVNDFRVQGVVGHAPKPRKERSGALGRRGGRGLVHKELGLLNVNPDGAISDKDVAKVINRQAANVHRCYETVRRSNPTAQGRVVLQWLVGADGNVLQVKTVKDDVGSQELLNCLRSAAKTWRFPPPEGGMARVRFPFKFSAPGL